MGYETITAEERYETLRNETCAETWNNIMGYQSPEEVLASLEGQSIAAFADEYTAEMNRMFDPDPRYSEDELDIYRNCIVRMLEAVC